MGMVGCSMLRLGGRWGEWGEQEARRGHATEFQVLLLPLLLLLQLLLLSLAAQLMLDHR